MAALFNGASTQYLVNSTPSIVALPFCVGMWVNLTAVGAVARTLFGLSDTATTNNYSIIRMTSGELLQIAARTGSTENTFNCGSLVAGQWHFLVARFIAATNRRCSQIQASGTVSTGSSVTNRPLSGADTMTLGALSTSGGITEPWDGEIGEFWITDADIGTDPAADIGEPLLRQLAYGGPFSVPNIVDSIIEYRSFRKYPSSDGDEIREVYFGAAGIQIWTNTNGVTIGSHPPLPYWYVRPTQYIRELVV